MIPIAFQGLQLFHRLMLSVAWAVLLAAFAKPAAADETVFTLSPTAVSVSLGRAADPGICPPNFPNCDDAGPCTSSWLSQLIEERLCLGYVYIPRVTLGHGRLAGVNQGAAKFDLPDLRAYSSSQLTRAVLAYNARDQIASTETGVIPSEERIPCIRQIALKTGGPPDIGADQHLPSFPALEIENLQALTAPTVNGSGSSWRAEWDVTWGVEQWLIGALPNSGFVLRDGLGWGVDLDSIGENHSCDSSIENLALELTIAHGSGTPIRALSPLPAAVQPKPSIIRQTPAGPPDLAVTAIQVRPASGASGDCDPGSDSFTVVVKNRGSSASGDFDVQLLIDRQPGPMLSVKSLDPNGERKVDFEKVSIRAGKHNVGARVDPSNDVAEQDEGHNTLEVSIDCVAE